MTSTQALFPFLRPYRRWVILAPLLMMVEVLMDLMQPRLVQTIIDSGVAKGDLGEVFRIGGLMILLALIGLIGGMVCTIYALKAALYFGADLRGALFRKVQSLSFTNLDQLETGKLVTRLTNDVTQVQELVGMALRIMVRAPLLLVGSVIMAVLTAAKLSLLFIVLIPLILVILVVIFRHSFPMFSRVQAQLDRVNVLMQENLAGVRVVRAFARAPYEIGRFAGVNEDLMRANLSAVRFSALVMPLMMLVMNGATVAVLWFGGHQVNSGDLEVGQLVAFSNYLMQSLFSLMIFSMLVVRISRAEASAERIAEVLTTDPSIVDAPQALTTMSGPGRVEYQHVSFRYPGADVDAIHDVSFAIEPGKRLAIIGSTGSGKSTLVQMLPRFYEATEGRITIDGVDIREIEQEYLHARVGVALQEVVLFSGTIRDNIRFGNPTASEFEVVRAASMAQAAEFIGKLPDGYDALVGQRGVNLSGGQKQRLSIARAILPKPTVLVLDDSTSAVDTATEARILGALDELNQTRIVVAQRITTVMGADWILVMDGGRVVGQGTHDDLLATNEMYREIYASQMEVMLDGAA
ncbi:MAG: ABC transporter ATP-binding protein [Thermomicrobiales bacterium]